MKPDIAHQLDVLHKPKHHAAHSAEQKCAEGAWDVPRSDTPDGDHTYLPDSVCHKCELVQATA